MKSQTCSGCMHCMPCVVCRSDLQIPFSCEFSMLYSTQHSLIWLPGPTFCSEVCVTPAARLKSHVHISCERSGHTPRQQVSSNFRPSVTISEATHLKINPHPAFAWFAQGLFSERRVFKGARAFCICTFWPCCWHSFLKKDRDRDLFVFRGLGRDFTGLNNVIHCSLLQCPCQHSQPLQVSASRCCPYKIAWIL